MRRFAILMSFALLCSAGCVSDRFEELRQKRFDVIGDGVVSAGREAALQFGRKLALTPDEIGKILKEPFDRAEQLESGAPGTAYRIVWILAEGETPRCFEAVVTPAADGCFQAASAVLSTELPPRRSIVILDGSDTGAPKQ